MFFDRLNADFKAAGDLPQTYAATQRHPCPLAESITMIGGWR